MMEYQKPVVLESWSDGVSEDWSTGVLVKEEDSRLSTLRNNLLRRTGAFDPFDTLRAGKLRVSLFAYATPDRMAGPVKPSPAFQA